MTKNLISAKLPIPDLLETMKWGMLSKLSWSETSWSEIGCFTEYKISWEMSIKDVHRTRGWGIASVDFFPFKMSNFAVVRGKEVKN